MTFRDYLSSTVFVILLVWGPVNHSWPGWLAIRIGYVILIPLLIWLFLNWVWSNWQFNKKINSILNRILSSIIFIALCVFAMIEATASTHIGNTQWIQAMNGREAVGENILLTGPNWGNVFLLLLFAVLMLWFGILKKSSKNDV